MFDLINFIKFQIDFFLKSSFLRITPPCNTSNGNKQNELRDRFVSQIVINWIGRIVARNGAIGRIRKHSNKMFHRTIEHPHTTKLLRCAPKRRAPKGLISTRSRTNLGFRLTVTSRVAKVNVCPLGEGTEDSLRNPLCCDHLIAIVAQRLGPIDSSLADTIDGITDSLSFKGCLSTEGS